MWSKLLKSSFKKIEEKKFNKKYLKFILNL